MIMPISPETFFSILTSNGVDFFTGVPDSLLKELCFYINNNVPSNRHIIAANEGNAIAIAAGYHLGTGKLPLVYMQNSGFSNAVNPLLSLCDPEVYSIPILLLIGWRGVPGIHDEPQHIKQGNIQKQLMEIMDIPYKIISKDDREIKSKLTSTISSALKNNRPYAILVKKGTFKKYISNQSLALESLMTREEALEIILNKAGSNSITVSTTGKTAREIFEIRDKNYESHCKDVLTVGSMGHCSSIALGIALAKPERTIICIDGDGALIMHMGSLATIGKLKPKNFKHILINNRAHESVGGQETAADYIDIPAIAKANSYRNVYSVVNKDELKASFGPFLKTSGPSFLEVNVRQGSRKDLGRPTIKPVDNKKGVMSYLR